MLTLYIILFICSSVYAGVMIYLAGGIQRLPGPLNTDRPKVSIIVAMRNETANIPHLMPALLAQDYPSDRLEIILVDDASSDDTVAKIETFIAATRNIRLLHSHNREGTVSPKKQAIALGIEQAQGDWLLFTDADCIPPPGWVTGMVGYFTDKVGLVVGFSPLELPPPKTLGRQLLAIESLSLAALTAGTAGRGRPATCTGRNLAYRKHVYQQVGGFREIAHLVSGDDDLLLKLVVEKTSWQIAYALQPSVAVPSRQPEQLNKLIRQRLRHASKSFHYSTKMIALLSLGYLFNLMLLGSIVFALATAQSLIGPVFCWTLKSAGDWVLVALFARKMGKSHYLVFFPLAELLHVPYVVIFGALGPVMPVHWKR